MHTQELQGDFDREVLETSRSTPVVVDFWADWCGPCRVLGPILERLALESDGRWRLVKVDTERHPDLAARFGIRGIPAVKLFAGGREVAEFVGALPEPEVRAWLETHLPGPHAAQIEAARTALERGDRAEARRILEGLVAQAPDDSEARLLLAQARLLEDPAASLELLQPLLADAGSTDAAAWLAHLARLACWGRGDTAYEPPAAGAAAELRATYRDAARALAREDFEAALRGWIAVLAADRTLDADGARRACIALFAWLGEDHPLTRTWRRRFSMALH